jgi:hypothetical protein
MVVIHGESNSGKSSKALSLIDLSKKCLYFALDFDKSIKSLELKNKNLEVTAFKNSFLVDLEFEILSHGGLFQNKLSYVVIDPLNLVCHYDGETLINMLDRLAKIEKDYKKIKFISVLNTLHHFELGENVKSIEGIEFIETKKKEKKKFITL